MSKKQDAERRERLRRVEAMEASFRRASAAVSDLERAVADYEDAQPDLKALSDYYAGPDWRSDFLADEAGGLPPDLPRGVLSEDGLWDLLEDRDRLLRRLRRLAGGDGEP